MANDILQILGINPASPGEEDKPAMFENPFSFNGRARRTEFGISMLLYVVMYLHMIGYLLSSFDRLHSPAVFLVMAIPALWFLWSQAAKRCHDLGHSGWYQLIPFYVFWLLFQDGQPGANEYGPNPKGEKSDMELSF
jgi:uncharacterized membrane protein YhaH (DUF805 family)